MPRKFNPLTAWLHSRPGLITGPSEQEAIKNAHVCYQAAGGKLPINDFKAALFSAGRLPAACYLNHDTGKWVYRIALPEKRVDVAPYRSASIEVSQEGRRMKWTHGEN